MRYGKEHYELARLILAAIDESITADQFLILDKQLGEDPNALEFYAQLMSLQSQLRQPQNLPSEISKESFLDDRLWQMLLEDQRNAETVEVKIAEERIPILVQKVKQEKIVRKINKGSLFTAILSAAALIFFIVFAKFAPVRTGVQVATLSDSLDAKWEVGDIEMENGDRLITSYTPLILQKGFAKVQFDNNVSVVIEAPAEFQIQAVDQINLAHGRLYAMVPTEAIGFTVNAGNAKVVDLGTEFGVKLEAEGNIELHVLRGKTNLFAGGKTNRKSQIVSAGNAKKISAGSQDISNIACKTELFVRDISSDHKYVWRGQVELNLADMVGGGNGLGTGRIDVWLDLKTGHEGTDIPLDPKLQVTIKDIGSIEKRFTDNCYHPVTHLPYVDGIFSPDGGAGDVQVNSRGDIWNDCPDTSGIYFEDIFNGSHIGTSYSHKLILNGQTYGTKESPALALHSNAGITFDLDALRADMPGIQIVKFKAICGISEEVRYRSKVDFHVLVDGVKRFQALEVQKSSVPREVSIPLNKEDRFLTLVTSDSDMYPNEDWGFFAIPRLEIE